MERQLGTLGRAAQKWAGSGGRGRRQLESGAASQGTPSPHPAPIAPLPRRQVPQDTVLKVLLPSVPSCQAGGGAGQWRGRLRNLREAPACTVTSYPCSQGWPPHPSGGKWAAGLQRRGGKKPATGWGNLIPADFFLGVSGVLWTPSAPQLITEMSLQILGRCKAYAALCQVALVSGEMAPGESPLQTCSPQIGGGAPSPAVGLQGVQRLWGSRGCVPMAAGSPLQACSHWSYNQLCLVCLKSTCSPCDLCPPRSGGVLLKNRGHQSPCLAEWVPRKVRESRAVWAKSSPLYQCPPTPHVHRSPEGPPPSSAAPSLPPPCP